MSSDHLLELLVGVEPAVVPGGEAVVGAVQEGILLLRTGSHQQAYGQPGPEEGVAGRKLARGHGVLNYERAKLFHGRCRH